MLENADIIWTVTSKEFLYIAFSLAIGVVVFLVVLLAYNIAELFE